MSTTQTLTELPSIQYSGIDYDSVISEIKSIIADNPNWEENWTSFYNSDAGTMFIQLMAWICDNLSIKQDTLYNEMFITTAQRDKDILKLLRLINYAPKSAVAAKVPVKFTFSEQTTNGVTLTKKKASSDTMLSRPSSIFSISGNDINGSSTTYELLKENSYGKPDYTGEIKISSGSVEYDSDSSGDSLVLMEGKTKSKIFTSSTADGPYFDLTDSNIIRDSIMVYDSTGSAHYEVDNFLQSEARDTSYGIPYVIEYTENGYTRIRYPSTDIMSAYPSRLYTAGESITVLYRTCTGSKGKIPASFINTTVTLSDESSNSVTATVYNESIGTGGTDQESVSNSALNGPLSIRTMDRAVTPSDYDIILNEYGTILKAKSYTSTNAPTGFKTYYGRYINPQEIFSFILLSKNYSDVPASEYNNYPWIELRHNNMFNEQYVFDSATYNQACTLGTLYSSITSLNSTSDSVTYKNAMIIDVSSDFNSAVTSGYDTDGNPIYNTDLKLKLTNSEATSKYFAQIPMSLLYDPTVDSDITTEIKNKTYITTDDETKYHNYELSSDTHARYISPKGITENILDSDGNKHAVIDCMTSQYIYIIVDGRVKITIDLWADKPEDYSLSYYYLALDNDVETSTTHTFVGVIKDALYRRGIKQLINEQIAGLMSDSDFMMIDNKSFQFMGLNKSEKTALFSSIASSGNSEYYISINGYKCRFYISKDYNSSANSSASSISKEDSFFPSTTNEESCYCLENIAREIEYQIYKGVFYVYDSSKSDYVEFYLVDETSDIHTALKNIHCMMTNNGIDSESLTTSSGYIQYDIAFIEDFEGTDARAATVKEITIDFTNESSDLMKDGFGITSIPSVQIAASYSSMANVLTNDSTEYLQILSPTTGSSSSIFFKKDTESTGDFLLNKFGTTYGINGAYTYTAYGQRTLTLIKKIPNSIWGPTQDTSLTVSIGSIIFTCNSINLPYDIASVYATFKSEVNNELVLGSVYDNFYLTGDSDVDDDNKPAVSGILGEYVDSTTTNGVTTYTINDNKSNYILKFTESKVDTNSIYSITDDLGMVPVDNISLYTNTLESFSGSSYSDLVFSMDSISDIDNISDSTLHSPKTFTVSVASCASASDLYSAIRTSLLSVTDDSAREAYTACTDQIIQKSMLLANQLVFSNVTKNDDSNLMFLYPSDGTAEKVDALYKELLGTNLQNTSLYTLYPKSIMDSDNIITVSDGVYYYAPTEKKPLVFKYRTMKTVNSVSTSVSPDYYVKHDGTKFYLCKTTDSNFQDAPFYLHFVNDRDYEVNSAGNSVTLEEDTLQNYMSKYKISGMEITFLKPYFKTFDVFGTVTYNRNFTEAQVTENVNTALNNAFSIDSMNIGKSLSRSKVSKIITNIDGVEGVDFTYFGFDYTDKSSYPNVDSSLSANFYDIIVLHEYSKGKHGINLTYKEEDSD